MAEIGGSRHYKGGEGRLAPAATKWVCPSCQTENLGVFTNGCTNDRCPSRMVSAPPVTRAVEVEQELAPAVGLVSAKQPLLLTDMTLLRTIASALVVYAENVLVANRVEGELSPEAATELAKRILADNVGESVESDAPMVLNTKYHLTGHADGISVDKWFAMDEMDLAAREQARLSTVFPDGVFSVNLEIPEEKDA